MDVHGMRVFARVAALSNISAAASELEMTPGNVSKRLQTLENSLGVRLFDRNTRMIRITEEGRMLLRSVTRILAEIDEVDGHVEPLRTGGDDLLDPPIGLSPGRVVRRELAYARVRAGCQACVASS